MSFEGVGQQEGLDVWRIEDFEAVRCDTSSYGKFHTGDSYIVLKTNNSRGKLTYNVHFWLGSETSTDEAGTAAIKTVELDDALDGVPVQYREVQGHESQLFISYFQIGIRYLPGGVKSGFTHVDPEAVEKRLFQVKGKRQVRVKQVPLDGKVLNKSDCWILDCGKGKEILVYSPPGAGKMERFRATQVANKLRDEDHAGNATVEIMSEFSGGDLFFSELGVEEDDIPETSEEDDSEYETSFIENVALYKVTDASGEFEVTEVGRMSLKQSMLDADSLQENDCYVLDAGGSAGIFVWIGRKSTKGERIQAMRTAETFLARTKLPAWTKVERVIQGSETTIFKQFFHTWKDSGSTYKNVLSRRCPAKMVAEWNISDMHWENQRRLAKAVGAAIGFSPDDSSGEKEVYRIENMELVPVPEETIGKFFGGDSYVVKYTCVSGTPKHVIYFWQGNHSSKDERAASAMHAVKMDEELKGTAVQVRVVQGMEPRHFVKMFGGKMIVYSGGKASGFKNVHDHDTYDKDGYMLFRVRGSSPDDVHVVQIQPGKACCLNSDDTFILETPTSTWIWEGEGSSPEEKETAQTVASYISPGRNAEVIAEGSEPESFWEALGGKTEYPKDVLEANKPILEPRLFYCTPSRLSGKFRAFEIYNFELKDLAAGDVMILDTGAEIYVWTGRNAKEKDVKRTLQLAKDYLANDPTERNLKNTLILMVKEGQEPESFKCCFAN